jgi:lipoprotein NlpD
VVRPQDTLYGIAWRHDLDYRELAKWNNIGSDYRLAVGQVLQLHPGRGAVASPAPRARAGTPPAANPSPPADAAARAAAAVPPKRAPPPSQPSPSSRPPPAASAGGSTTSGSTWVWPTDRTGPPRPVPGGGILIFGRLGQDIRAAETGRVVYTGNGIRGYGNLIIIKHGETLLSSYAHNREVLVKEGQDVSVGQTIAHMGTGPHQVSVLYFEIRANGKPVDPLGFLTPPR